MKTMRIARLAAVSLVLAALWGCGKTAPTSPTDNSNLTTQQASELALQIGMLSVQNGTDVPTGMQMSLRAQRAPGSMRAVRANWDTTVTGPTSTVQLSIEFYDSTGAVQGAYDSLTTDRMHVDSWVHGDASNANGTFTLGTSSTLDVTGLRRSSDRQHSNGARADTVQWAWSNDTVSVSHTTRCTGTITDVVRMKPVDSGYPLSGSIRWTLAASTTITAPQATRRESVRGTALVEFNGTRYATLTVNGLFRYTLDLDTGQVTPIAA